MAFIVAHHENIRRGGLDRTSELLRDVGKVDRRGRREDISARDVFESQVFVRPFNAGGVPFRGGSGGGVNRRCSGVSKVRRHEHGAVIGYGQAPKKQHQLARGPLPLAGDARDLRNWGSSAAVRGGVGSRSASSWAASPVLPVTRALDSVSPTSSTI